MKPILGITMGDPAGIGPEVIVKAFVSHETRELLRDNKPFVVGDADVLRAAAKFSNVNVEINAIDDVDALKDARFALGVLNVLDLDNVVISELAMGKISGAYGRASLDYIEAAAGLACEGKIHAVVTAPVNKQALKQAGHPYPGHTETLAVLTGVSPDDVTMMLVAGNLRVFHVTLHQSLKDAIASLSKAKVLEAIKIANNGLKSLGCYQPKIAVAALNPHASDGGRFGDEDLGVIKPAVEEAQKQGINAFGPIPADTVFVRARKGEFDGVVAQYHDQGHIPTKLLGFMEGVNITIGLPIIRTSVDHGTAFDIAGEGKADCANIIAAMKLASQMAKAKYTD